jgi:hypothetical protein
MEEPLFLRDILELPARSEKPRKVGRTICGISLGRGRESIEQVAQYIDQVKLYVHNTLMPAAPLRKRSRPTVPWASMYRWEASSSSLRRCRGSSMR